MRRPLPPELIVLGDHLEAAASRALGRRRARRQLVLNAMASLAVAVPVVASIAVQPVSAPVTPPAVAPDLSAGQVKIVRAADDFPPRLLRRLGTSSNGDVLYLPIDLRRALR